MCNRVITKVNGNYCVIGDVVVGARLLVYIILADGTPVLVKVST